MKLGEAITLKRGYDLPLDQRIPGPYPIVTSSGVAEYHQKFKAQGPGVVTGRTGTLGKVYYVQQDFWPHNTALYVQNFKGNNPRFIFYLLQTLGFELRSAAAAVPTLNRNYLHLLSINLPPLWIQERISQVLRKFDDIIENNRSRIQIIEEMARTLYREWFVHFRFPGHEEVEMIDSKLGGIPGGWYVDSFSSLADFQNGFAFKPKHWQEEGMPIVKIAEMKKGFGSTTKYYHGKDIDEKYHIKSGDLLFAWSASLFVCFWTKGNSLLNQHIFLVKPKPSYSKYLIHSMLQEALPRFQSLAHGTTMRHIRRSALDDVETVIPPEHLRNDFDRYFEPLIRLSWNLHIQNETLQEMKDLLLPRLVSGEIDVSEIQIELSPLNTRKTSKYENEHSTPVQWLDGDEEDGRRK